MSQKKQLGNELAKRVKDREIIAVGTGSTVDAAIDAISRRIAHEKLTLYAVATSFASERRCAEAGFRVLSASALRGKIPWGFDGADEVDPDLQLLKGRGGALLREKLVAARCNHFIILVEERKLVARLGEHFPVPVEAFAEAVSHVAQELRNLGAVEVVLRDGAPGKHGPVVTEYGHVIVDVTFSRLPPNAEQAIKSITGVVETGIFTSQADEVLVATSTGVEVRSRRHTRKQRE